jgi:[acyl-carrier-protein] S-malonyltransferase
MAGHSLGEYTALVASGALEFGAALQLVIERAQRMQAATPAGTGAMAAIIGLEEEKLSQVCAEAAEGQVVSCANLNAPGQIVIAGDQAAVERACALALEAGARRALPLAVSVPSHCALMTEASGQFKDALSRTVFDSGGIPVLHNVDARPRSDSAGIRLALQQQLWQPVRWIDTILELSRLGVTRFAECGPGKVLAGLNRRIVAGAEVVCLADLDSMRDTLARWR